MRRSECKRFTRRLVFYRKRYLRFYILGPTRKMFDVHILSINVDIHYISVLIKYFSRGHWFDCYVHSEIQSYVVLKQCDNIHVTGTTYIMAEQQPASPAGKPSVLVTTTTSKHTCLYTVSLSLLRK